MTIHHGELITPWAWDKTVQSDGAFVDQVSLDYSMLYLEDISYQPAVQQTQERLPDVRVVKFRCEHSVLAQIKADTKYHVLWDEEQPSDDLDAPLPIRKQDDIIPVADFDLLHIFLRTIKPDTIEQMATWNTILGAQLKNIPDERTYKQVARDLRRWFSTLPVREKEPSRVGLRLTSRPEYPNQTEETTKFLKRYQKSTGMIREAKYIDRPDDPEPPTEVQIRLKVLEEFKAEQAIKTDNEKRRKEERRKRINDKDWVGYKLLQKIPGVHAAYKFLERTVMKIVKFYE